MAFPEFRYRVGYVFLFVAVGHIVLISAQVNSRSGVPLLEAVVFGAFSEIQRAAAGLLGGVERTWSSYVALRDARREADQLRRELGDAQIKLQQLRVEAERAARLEALLGFRDTSGLETTAANVIAGSPTADLFTVTIDKGSHDGLARDMAVLVPAGVVGRVVTSAPRAAKVQLLVDRSAAAGALLARSRDQGVVTGTGEHALELHYLSSTADVREGDVVLSSGIDGVYPKGFVIGHVESVERAGGAYARVVVRPSVDFAALEEVLVVLNRGTPAVDPGVRPDGNGGSE